MEVTINAYEFRKVKLKDLLEFLDKQKINHKIEYRGAGNGNRNKKSNTNNKTIKRTI